jgi:hypothetical protein
LTVGFVWQNTYDLKKKKKKVIFFGLFLK